MSLVYDADATGLGVAFIEFFGGGSSLSSDVWTGFTAVGTSQTIELPVPPDTSVTFNGNGSYASYLLALYEDTDASGTQDPGENWVSADRLAMWVAEPLPADFAAAGFTAGWNVSSTSEFKAYPISAVPVALHRPSDSITIGGPTGKLPADTAAGVALDSNVDAPPLYDAPVDGDFWSVTASGAPPDEFVGESFKVASGVPLLYLDYGAVGYGDDDEGYAVACLNNAYVLLVWAKLDNIEEYLAYVGYGVAPGWTAGTYASSGAAFQAIPAEQLNAIPMERECI